MIDSGTKPPENRIHLFDPVGLITDNYGGTYKTRARRPTKSYGNFEEVSNTNGGLKSYDSFNSDAIGMIRSYDSLTDMNNPGLRSYNSFSMEKNGVVGIKSFDTDNHILNDINDDHNNNDGLEIRFGVDNNSVVEDDSDVSTPRLWKKPSSPTSPKALNNIKSSDVGQLLHNVNNTSYSNNFRPTSPSSMNSTNSSPFHPKASMSLNSSPRHPKNNVNSMNSSLSANSSPLHPTVMKSMHNSSMSANSSPLHPANVKAVNSSAHLSANSSPLHPSSPKQMYHHNLSPSSRTQAIARGRREMMDMVRDLPESFYELSLRDIVEQKAEMEVQKDIVIPEEKMVLTETSSKPQEKKKKKKSGKKVNKSESKKKMVKSRSVDNGRFLLRTSVFPIFSGSKKNKKNLGGSSSFKVAPMPKPQPPAKSVSMKGSERDWWRRKSCISSESDNSNGLSSKSNSSGSSSSSSLGSSSNGRRSNRFLPTCCLFNGRRIRSKK